MKPDQRDRVHRRADEIVFFPQHLCVGSPFLRPCKCQSRIIQKWFSDGQGKNKSQKFFKFSKMTPPGNHKNTTFRTFLEPWGPRDLPWIQERKILFRIALTRALYDQMAPQLCHFYISATVDFFVPRQPTIFCVNLATRAIIITTTNVSGGRSRRRKSFLYYSALPLAGTKKRRPKT